MFTLPRPCWFASLPESFEKKQIALRRMRGGRMARRLALSVGFGGTPEQNKELIKRVQVAEEAGVEAVFTAETWGRDQFSLLTQLALATKTIKIGTGIAPVFGRSPGVLAM